MDDKKKKCGHIACACHVVKEETYCSAFCSGEGDTADIKCSCGHPGCAGPEPASA